MNLQLFADRGRNSGSGSSARGGATSPAGRAGGGGGGGRGPTKTGAITAFNGHVAAFTSGSAPDQVQIDGVTYNKTKQDNYTSGGGFVVHTYEYQAPANYTVKYPRFSFNATQYKKPDGSVVDYYKRFKPKILHFNAYQGRSALSSGSSGGISRRNNG